jgi:hypothetical protein
MSRQEYNETLFYLISQGDGIANIGAVSFQNSVNNKNATRSYAAAVCPLSVFLY